MRYVLRKLAHLLPVLFIVTGATFLLLEFLPGDAALGIAGADATTEQVAAVRAELGLDDPLPVRYGRWLGGFVTGDLGYSFVTKKGVAEELALRLPITLQLILLSQIIALALAIPGGIACALYAGTAFDRAMTTAAMVVLATPVFILAIVLMLVLSLKLGWLPTTGYVAFSEDPIANLRHMALPALAIGLAEWPILMRVLRSDLIGTLSQDFIAMARAKGLSPARILFTHALRPSSLTLTTVTGLQLASLIGGAVVIETIFALPGIGRMLVSAILESDVMIVQGTVAVVAVGYVIVNFAVDLMCTALDPRIAR